MVALNIGELARRAGLQTSAIRYYESIGLMPAPPRASGWRRYDPAALDRLQVIKSAREVGFTVGEISMLLNGFPKGTPASKRWRKMAKKKLPEVDQLIARATALRNLVQAGLNCTCACFPRGPILTPICQLSQELAAGRTISASSAVGDRNSSVWT